METTAVGTENKKPQRRLAHYANTEEHDPIMKRFRDTYLQGYENELIYTLANAMDHTEFLGFLRGNVFKYMWCMSRTDNSIKEILKAQEYLEWVLELELIAYEETYHERRPNTSIKII